MVELELGEGGNMGSKWLWVVLLSIPAVAQNYRYDGVVQGPKGLVPFATVAVCTQPANTSTQPCSPLANLCSTLADAVCVQPNPVTADFLGNFHFYFQLAQEPFTYQLYGPQVASVLIMPDQQALTAQLPIGLLGGGTFSNPSAGVLLNTIPSGNAEWKLSATTGANTSIGGLFAVSSNGHNGEMQWQINDVNPFGWRFCAIAGPTLCPVLIDGGAGLSGTVGMTLTNAVNDVALVFSATNGGTVSSQTLQSVAMNGRSGEFQFRMNSTTPDPLAAWEFANVVGTSTPVSFNVNAPNSSLQVNAAGQVLAASSKGFCFTANICWTSGAGVPSGGSCTAANGGSLFSRTDGGTTTTLYVCDNSTHVWTPK